VYLVGCFHNYVSLVDRSAGGTNPVTFAASCIHLAFLCWVPERYSGYSDYLEAVRSGVEIPAGVRNLLFYTPLQTSPGDNLSSFTVNGLFPLGSNGRGVKLSPQPHLALRLKISRAILLLPL
jgi:hypothetical protein